MVFALSQRLDNALALVTVILILLGLIALVIWLVRWLSKKKTTKQVITSIKGRHIWAAFCVIGGGTNALKAFQAPTVVKPSAANGYRMVINKFTVEPSTITNAAVVIAVTLFIYSMGRVIYNRTNNRD